MGRGHIEVTRLFVRPTKDMRQIGIKTNVGVNDAGGQCVTVIERLQKGPRNKWHFLMPRALCGSATADCLATGCGAGCCRCVCNCLGLRLSLASKRRSNLLTLLVAVSGVIPKR